MKEDLYLQLHTTKQDADEDICNFLIESLDEHGFLNSSAAEYAEILGKAPICIQKNIQILQMFEPAGVAARDSIDSIRLQLLRNKKYTAEKIFTQYAEELIRKDYKAIAKDCGLSMEAVTQSLLEIQGCQPYPCSSYAGENNAILLPDFEIQTLGDEIEIIPKQLGHFQIQDELQAVKNDKELRAYFDEAYYFIDHLSKRNKTLLIMVNALIHIQRNHFLYMDELQPCTLLDIANKTGFHESTVSRTLSNKYYLFYIKKFKMKI
ncbi:RNA polymerase subunit sigma-54 [[Clostridium] innocuum]|uniref:RNA polymerase factor sigma-54 n=1 Tax=Clostridium innocuum TaxID=1522 RepID=UPI001F059EE9|nr:RNA polymerase subunit sigma-54 [[Clostridium] innocuum]MCH1946693.1 RNA polymerase subunit sigma-54 [[Clostridium] innocuum]MCH1957574.1 RNA polymerase subunit sigma-54 [[Clostridium] innocuum]